MFRRAGLSQWSWKSSHFKRSVKAAATATTTDSRLARVPRPSKASEACSGSKYTSTAHRWQIWWEGSALASCNQLSPKELASIWNKGRAEFHLAFSQVHWQQPAHRSPVPARASSGMQAVGIAVPWRLLSKSTSASFSKEDTQCLMTSKPIQSQVSKMMRAIRISQRSQQLRS